MYVCVPDIGLAVRVFANGPGDLGSIPGRVIPKTQKMVLHATLLNTQHYKVRIKGKVEQSGEGVAPSPTLWCSRYRKGSLRVTLDYGRQLYFYLHPYRCLTYAWVYWIYAKPFAHFVREPLIHGSQCKKRWSDKVKLRLKRLQLYCHTF